MTDQLDFDFSLPRARRTDPATSHGAAVIALNRAATWETPVTDVTDNTRSQALSGARLLRTVRKAVVYRLVRIKHKWWSWQNWRKGYKFGPIQRCRRCDHTTPYHYPTCWDDPAVRDRYAEMEET